MRYAHSLTIPANIAEADALEETLELCYGTIRQVYVLNPPGGAGLVHLQIFYQSRQIFPSTPGETFIACKQPRAFEENWPIYEVPHEVILRGWNFDETYEHTIYVELSVLQPEILMPVLYQPPTLPEGV